MPSSYTSSLRLTLPVQGELSGSWGNTVNTGITQLVDTAVAGTASITMTAANYTLSNNNGVSDEARSMFLTLGGTPGNSFNVICPAVSKLYFVTNNTGYAQTVKTSAGTGISVPNGARMTLYCDGTNVVVGENYFASLSLGAALPTGSGGTGLTSFTANGVAYASSSSALTTGSALVFDGTNLGVGTSSPGAKLDVAGLARTGGNATNRGDVVIQQSDNTAAGSGGLEFKADGANSGYGARIKSLFNGVSAYDLGFQLRNNSASWSTQMLLDTSGNLGLGVTPSAWGSVYKAIQNGQSAFMSRSGGSDCYILSNNYYDGTNFRYINTAAAAYYRQDSGAHAWLTAPSGTAGNAISFTQAMTLDSSGRLGIGTASPGSPLHVNGPQSNPQIRVNDGNVEIYAAYSSGTGASAVNYYGTGSNHAQAFLTNNIERGRFSATGEFGLGTGSPRGDLDVGTSTATAITKSIHLGFSQSNFYGFRIANANTASLTYAGTLAFQRGTGAAWADVVTITDGGNLLVNTSTIAGDGGYTFLVQAGGIAAINNNNSASTGYVFSSYRRGGTEIGSVTQNGTTAVLFNTTSDRRLKDNIVPAPSASDVIDAIEIVSHDWKAAPDEHVTYGVIAQDLALVAPQAVLQGNDGDEIEKTWGVDYSKLVPMLIKEIQSLRARVAALEAA